jgi:hypothetical protein
MNEETVQPIIQFLPEEYQGMAITFVGIITACIALYTLIIAPIMNKIGANKAVDAINNSMLSEQQIGDIVNQGIEKERISRIKSELVKWKFKLPYSTDETRPMIEAEIIRLEEELSQCSSS